MLYCVSITNTRIRPTSEVPRVALLAAGWRPVTGSGVAPASCAAWVADRPAAATASSTPRVLETARASWAVVDVSVDPTGSLTSSRRASTIAMSIRPERRSRSAACRFGSATRLTVVKILVPTATVAARSGAERAPTTATCSTRGCPLRRTGMTMAAATTARMSSVPTRKTFPRTRSRTSLSAIKPVSPMRSASRSRLLGDLVLVRRLGMRPETLRPTRTTTITTTSIWTIEFMPTPPGIPPTAGGAGRRTR